jgi:hypothetical protein
MATIYVELLDEGTVCYRPVEAFLNEDGTYTILSIPDDEKWRFQPNDTVVCEQRIDHDGKQYLLAVKRK